MSMSTGARLGAYQVVAAIGAGGMGEVYRARDSRLSRNVALKVLPANLASDAHYMARFQREAQVLASLNHPHIASIYGLEESGAVRALVMELVEGPTLADRIKKGPIPLEEALEIARQIVEALEYAHEKGVIHRDLKPANVKITPEGTVKVLDFGLAKAAEQLPETPEWEDAPTLPPSMSRPGVILGTPAYMAPEQARGETADKRADIWAFGVVLWEMLCGRRLFGGATTADTLTNVLSAEIDVSKLPPSTPIGIRRLLKRCLERDRRSRLQAIGDARLEIEEYLADPAGAVLPARRQLLAWVVAAVFAGVASGIALLHFRQALPESRLIKYSIPPPEKNGYVHLAPSPDGRLFGFVAADSADQNQLWVRRLDSLDAQPLAGTAGVLLPFWSPDSRFIGFWADGKLKKIDVGTPSVAGPPQTICDAEPGGGTWSRDGVIVFGAETGLYRVAASGGGAKAITGLDRSKKEKALFWPSFLPDGRHFLYTVVSEQPENSGIYVGSLDSPERKRLLGDRSNAVYVKAPSGEGYLLYLREGTLMAERFNDGKLQLVGDPSPVARQVRYDWDWAQGTFSVSENGVLVFVDGRPRVGQTQLTWFDRTGNRLGTVGEPADYGWRPYLSPDDRQVAADLRDPKSKNSDIWLIDLVRGIPSRFTFDPAEDTVPVWSPDGRRIIFNSRRSGALDLYEKDARGGAREELLLHTGGDKWANSWSPDGRFLMYCEGDGKSPLALWLLPLLGDRKPVPFLKAEFVEADASFSPDGKWVSYESRETGQAEIYVRTFPSVEAKASTGLNYSVLGKWRISNGGGKHARWRRDGRELFYRTDDGKILAAEISTGPPFQAGVPRLLFETRFSNELVSFAVTADGQRFLIPTPIDPNPPATLVLNWTRELKP
jgi:eukaryotic-like serine/threonine-protein kinase